MSFDRLCPECCAVLPEGDLGKGVRRACSGSRRARRRRTRFGDYEIIDEIAWGGMGVV